jgi:hypothetical protein
VPVKLGLDSVVPENSLLVFTLKDLTDGVTSIANLSPECENHEALYVIK